MPRQTASIPPAPPAPATPSSKGSGYYLDDGPHEKPVIDPNTVPDAVPRAEPLNRATMRSYTVMGRSYTPMTALAPYKARGVASWYGRRYHGKLTSSGERYDMYGMTAAHPILPIPSYVRVTHAANGRSVVVRVNDRGPFIDSRLIDLSYTAAHKLGVIAGGSAQVEVELILPGSALPPLPVSRPEQAMTAADPPPVAAPEAERRIAVATEAGGIYLQLAAFGSRDNAEIYAERLRGELFWMSESLAVFTRDSLFRVQAGPFATAEDARQAAERIGLTLGFKPATVAR